MPPLIEVTDLKKHFPIRKGILGRTVGNVLAVDGISFSIGEGETLGLVGESGCGKTTVARTVLRLIEPTSGQIKIRGQEISGLSKTEMRPLRRQMQIVFQDPFSSLNPRIKVGKIVGEPLKVHHVGTAQERQERVAQLFQRVGLRPEQINNYPHQFSGGQRQRVSIARALALDPGFIVADEPVSALDVSIQAQVINLLMDLQRELKLSYLFVSHNLAVVEHISHRVAVMYLGRIVEYADKASLFEKPLHPYTEALARGGAVARSVAGAGEASGDGRCAKPDQSSIGLSFSSALPDRRGTLSNRAARAKGNHPRPSGVLPLTLIPGRPGTTRSVPRRLAGRFG